MKNTGKGSIIILLCIIFLTGCGRISFSTGLGREEVFKISGEVCTLSEVKLFLGIKKHIFESSFGKELWGENIGELKFEDYVKQSVKNEMSQLACINLLAKEKNISLGMAEEKKCEEIAGLYFDSLSGEQIENTGITLKNIESIVRKYAISQKVYEQVTGELAIEVSDADAKVIKVESIFVKACELEDKGKVVPYRDDEVKKAKQKAEKLYERIKSGANFTELALGNSDDDTVEYEFCKEEMEEEFAKAAFALNDGEVSNIIWTHKGFYIIKCISAYLPDESAAKKAELIKIKKAEAFKSVYDPFVDTLACEFNTRLWNKIPIRSLENIPNNLYDVFEENYIL